MTGQVDFTPWFCFTQRREEHASDNRDDRDDYKQVNQGESTGMCAVTT
jgi:hypothetical protein